MSRNTDEVLFYNKKIVKISAKHLLCQQICTVNYQFTCFTNYGLKYLGRYIGESRVKPYSEVNRTRHFRV